MHPHHNHLLARLERPLIGIFGMVAFLLVRSLTCSAFSVEQGLLEQGRQATAVVTEVREHKRTRGSGTVLLASYAFRVEREPHVYSVVEERVSLHLGRPAKVGDSFLVTYNASDPDEHVFGTPAAEAVTRRTSWQLPALGVVVLGGGGLVLFLRRLRGQAKTS